MNVLHLWQSTIAGLLLALNVASVDAAYYNDDAAAAGDDGGNYYKNAAQDDDDKADNYSGDDFIKYWTEYAVLPQKCIHLGGKDVIVYSIYEKYYNHCADKAVGTYMIDVPTFMSAYIEQVELNAEDMANGDDYVAPDGTYVNCYPYETNNGVVSKRCDWFCRLNHHSSIQLNLCLQLTHLTHIQYYVQLGCTDGTSQSLSVNVYKDNTCTQHDRNADGIDDTTIDVSNLQPPFGQCTSCVHFVDKNEDDVDDRYFENRMKNAPLCENIWEYKQKCGGKCKRMGNVGTSRGWNSSDKLLLTVLGVFSKCKLYETFTSYCSILEP